MHKTDIKIIILLVAVIVIGIFLAWFFPFTSVFSLVTPSQKACTMEGKLCPDGSAVVRTGPNCEFAECPDQRQSDVCNQNSDCEVAYSGDSTCWPCNADFNDEDFKCVTAEESKKIFEQRRAKIGNVLCESCFDFEINFDCVCDAGNCKKSEKTDTEKSCTIDSDCACGVKIDTRDCFFGNKNYVDTKTQCPDFCTGIDGRFVLKCVNNSCVHMHQQ